MSPCVLQSAQSQPHFTRPVAPHPSGAPPLLSVCTHCPASQQPLGVQHPTTTTTITPAHPPLAGLLASCPTLRTHPIMHASRHVSVCVVIVLPSSRRSLPTCPHTAVAPHTARTALIPSGFLCSFTHASCAPLCLLIISRDSRHHGCCATLTCRAGGAPIPSGLTLCPRLHSIPTATNIVVAHVCRSVGPRFSRSFVS